jgi:hypothetical protein
MDDDDTLKNYTVVRYFLQQKYRKEYYIIEAKTPQPYLFLQSDFYLLYLPVILLKLQLCKNISAHVSNLIYKMLTVI